MKLGASVNVQVGQLLGPIWNARACGIEISDRRVPRRSRERAARSFSCEIAGLLTAPRGDPVPCEEPMTTPRELGRVDMFGRPDGADETRQEAAVSGYARVALVEVIGSGWAPREWQRFGPPTSLARTWSTDNSIRLHSHCLV